MRYIFSVAGMIETDIRWHVTKCSKKCQDRAYFKRLGIFLVVVNRPENKPQTFEATGYLVIDL